MGAAHYITFGNHIILIFFFPKPPVLLEDINTKGLSPDILVAGDIISKKYDFMMGDLDNNPYKIAQVHIL